MPKAAGKSMSKRRVVAKARAHVPKKKNNVLRSGQIRSIAGKGSKLKRKQNHRVGLARADGPLDFYAVVRVGRGGDVPTDAEGRLGVVVGRAEEEDGGWNYSVSLQGVADSYYLPHEVLSPTGVVLRRADLYGNGRFRVRVDESGTGTKVDETASGAE